ncbi:hypothetical protein GTA62_20370 [Roseobacter sp. HKCCD9010]|uniref:hypothetical protein n=1 Tax=unclassified Roseobacter TaxID=196798 RepID=UPI001490D76F|nr:MULTISPECIES: hypothetical protein [unclassified Roseobacter]MBF9052317.1 hypothetical protein [Rhodobacterales bacterium HKCCD4356]NNV14320.1 hypothetical protein [Roseobacter sp. HKCCD7357]NNV18500.1 hypothetical protein [Roseobacter sp. HKCCD8768]NNV27970.1 hypothetical protein [Roseobacter sp. HKCCD8192]NNV32270.1 hypothetical protein [Roseobacter sp. HKCCD9061]
MTDWLKIWWERWRRDNDNWQNLHSYFKPVVMRFFISWFAAAPVVALLIRDYSWFVQLPFTWWVLWLASIAYSGAFLLYTFFCPSFVKLYPNARAYEERLHSPRYIVWQCYYYLRSGTKDGTKKLKKRLIEKGYATPHDSEPLSADPMKPKVEERGTLTRFELDGAVYELCIDENENEKKSGIFSGKFWPEMLNRLRLHGHWRGSCFCWL